MNALPLVFAALLVGAIALAVTLAVRVVTWWDVRSHRLDGLVDKRVLRPVAQRLTRRK